jgi:23S rRNA pseudouridine2457 synthase
MKHYFIIYKPYQVLSQFTTQLGKQTLADFFDVPKDVYPVGRLDEDSEGLLILTNDSQLNHQLLNPAFGHEREYWVQVEGAITHTALAALEAGVEINVGGKPYTTANCKALLFESPPAIAQRNPPIRYRPNISTTWIKMVLTEGKNRQVRKMTAKVGYPTLRLIRHRIEKLALNEMKSGDMIGLAKHTIYKKLFLQIQTGKPQQ